jgi:hypothetical protein
MSPPPTGTPRKRGAQPANQNATKHGLYSRYLRQAEIPPIQIGLPYDLTTEINLMRYVILRALELCNQSQESSDVSINLRLLDNVRRATSLLSRLLLLQNKYFGESASLQAMLCQKCQQTEQDNELLKPPYQPSSSSGPPPNDR